MTNPGQHQVLTSRTSLKTSPFVLALLLVVLATEAQAQTFTVIHTFTDGADGALPYSGLTMDRAGRLYGTTLTDATGGGTVFRLTKKGYSWVLRRFTTSPENGNGAWPEARVVFGPDGTLYGTTQKAGAATLTSSTTFVPQQVPAHPPFAPGLRQLCIGFRAATDTISTMAT